MIGSIKKLISGILSFLFGLIGGKKSQELQPESKAAELPGKVTGKSRRRSGYYLELDETEDNKPAAAKSSAATNGAKVKETAATVTQAVKAEAAKITGGSKSQPAASEAAKTATASNKQPVKAEAAKTEASANNQAAKVELVQTAEGVKAEPAKPAKTSVASNNGQAQTETTFAPKYLTPTNSNSRRRPGPNMSTYLDMARQVKTSS